MTNYRLLLEDEDGNRLGVCFGPMLDLGTKIEVVQNHTRYVVCDVISLIPVLTELPEATPYIHDVHVVIVPDTGLRCLVQTEEGDWHQLEFGQGD